MILPGNCGQPLIRARRQSGDAQVGRRGHARKMKTRHVLILAATLVAALVLFGIRTGSPAAEPYTITAILPLTGSGSFLGEAESQTLQVLEDVVNRTGGIQGRPVHFAVQDDQSSPQVGVQLLNGALGNKPAVILGSTLVATCSAMAPIAEKNHIFQYCFSPGFHPADNSFSYSSSVSTSDLLQVSARFAGEKRWKRIAYITSTDASGQDAERTIDAAFGDHGKYGESIVAREHFNPSDLSVAAQMARIKAADPQLVICWATGTPFATLLRGVQEAGISVPIMTGNGNLTYAQMHAYKAFLPEQLYIAGLPPFAPETLAGPVKKAVDNYLAAFKSHGLRPDAGAVVSWDGPLLEVEALRKLGPNATAEQVRSYIAGIQGWAGVNGTYNFNLVPQRGVAEASVVMVRWDPAKDTWAGASRMGGAVLK